MFSSKMHRVAGCDVDRGFDVESLSCARDTDGEISITLRDAKFSRGGNQESVFVACDRIFPLLEIDVSPNFRCISVEEAESGYTHYFPRQTCNNRKQELKARFSWICVFWGGYNYCSCHDFDRGSGPSGISFTRHLTCTWPI